MCTITSGVMHASQINNYDPCSDATMRAIYHFTKVLQKATLRTIAIQEKGRQKVNEKMEIQTIQHKYQTTNSSVNNKYFFVVIGAGGHAHWSTLSSRIVHVDIHCYVWMELECGFPFIHLREYGGFSAVVVECLVEVIDIQSLLHCVLSPQFSEAFGILDLELQVGPRPAKQVRVGGAREEELQEELPQLLGILFTIT